jgi:serine/threonine protein kinase/tetratricopeptide (TPR) repeat protein
VIGRTLAHYRITAGIGAGGMGEVYRATDTKLGRDVALKILPAEMASSPGRLERFRREAKALAALDHPGIVGVYSVEEADGVHFLTMQLVEGQPLDRLIPAGGLPVEQILEIARALAEALAAAHEKGIVHRDVKPGNVMVAKDGRVKVLDFGLAKITAPEKATSSDSELATAVKTRDGIVMGTVAYMSPEQLQGRTVDHRTDIFSLGVVLYEMTSGRRPFQGSSSAELVSAILRDTPQPLREVRTDVPADLERIARLCLEKNPRRRFQSALDVYNELEELHTESQGPAGRSSPGSAAPLAATSKRISAIAVLPLINLSHEPEEEYFADGMTDALITDLAKVGRLKVISRGSVMHYKGTTKPLSQIASELHVDAVVEGSVFRAGDRVRISAQLIRAATDEHMWAERYDRKLEDILALQDQLARSIAGEVDAALQGPSGATPRKVDPEVYLLDLRGRHAIEKRNESSFRTAVEVFQQSIDRDPTYAPSYAGLAESLSMLANYGIVAPPHVISRILAAAQKGLDLDESSADAHRVLAFVRWQFEFAWHEAITEYERALELAPNSALTNYWFGVFLSVIGFFDRAHVLLKRAQELDPLSLVIPAVQGWTYFFARRFEEALPYYRRVLAVDANHHVTLWFLGEALVELGTYDEGIAALDKALALSGRISRLLGYVGYAYGRAGRGDDARRMLAELESREREQYVPPYFPALVHCGLGETEPALDRLEQAYAVRDTMIRDLKADPAWDRLCSEPRFQTLMRKMAYPEPTN